MKTKECPKCEHALSLTEFNKSNRRDGYQTYCRSCHNNMQREKYALDPGQKIKRQIRANRRKNRDPFVAKKSELKRLYGITFEDYIEMLVEQDQVCAICKEECKTRKMLSVDHDHQSGKVRGLLCNRCNRAIGMMKDDIVILENAIQYLSDKLK
jgi:uncharacterized protein YbaR (Trm112 family)